VGETRPIDEDTAYLLGVLCGDGGIVDTKRPQERPRFYLLVKDFDFANHTEKCWKSIANDIGCRQWSVARPIGCRPGFWGFKSSSRVVEVLLKYFEPGRKALTWRVPSDIMNSSDSVKRHFLMGFFDSEGCVELDVKRHRRISASSSNPDGLADVRDLLLSLGFDCWINSNKVFITGKSEIAKFRSEIGFRLKRQQDKLDRLLGSYKWDESRNRYGRNVRDKIIELHNNGLSTRKIAKETGASKSYVASYIKMFRIGG